MWIFIIGFLMLIMFFAFVSVYSKSTAAALSHDEPIFVKIVDLQRKALETLVVFETMDGNRISLKIPPQSASKLIVDDAGLLTYHKTVFKSFVRQLEETPPAVSQS